MSIDIQYKNYKTQKILQNKKKLTGKYGDQNAKEIIQRMNELRAAKNLQDVKRLPQARLHLLSNNWEGHFAVDVKHPHRLILRPLNGDRNNLESITSIKIIEISEDYH